MLPNRFCHIILTLLAFGLIQGSPAHRRPQPIAIMGNTMGTTYHITYFDKRGRNFKVQVDSLLLVINRAISNYDPTSEVSHFNTSQRGIAIQSMHLRQPLTASKVVYQGSEGALDLTVMPLVNAWGFGPGVELEMNTTRVDSIRQFVGFDKVQIRDDSVIKIDPRVQLDFGGVGQGYGADEVGRFLKKKGVTDYLVELGGEGVAAGRNKATDRAWRIGILDPASTLDNQFFKAYVSLSDGSFTTAGSYFNYREVDGRRYSHTIDPATGYPVDRPLLSVSVFATDCLTADAWDTAFMVMGHEKSIEVLRAHPELQALLLYTNTDGSVVAYATPDIAASITYENRQEQRPVFNDSK